MTIATATTDADRDDAGELLAYAGPAAAPDPHGPTGAEPETGPPAVGVLETLLGSVANLRGALVATVDGRPLAAVLPSHDPGSTAAIVAASLGLGGRLADLTGEGRLEEIVVRSGSGYVVIYAVGERGVLVVLTKPSANLALLHLQARQACADLVAAVAAHR